MRLTTSPTHRPANLTVPLGVNRQVFLGGCLGARFALLENMLNVQADLLLELSTNA
jgi:hypothetical protein